MTATKKKQKKTILRTPPGTASWPKLTEPERKFISEKNPFGFYSIGIALALSDPATQDFIARMTLLYDEAVAAAAAEETPKERAEREDKDKPLGLDKPWKNEFDEAGEPTGNILFNAKLSEGGSMKEKNGNVRSWTNTPDLFDSKGRELPKDIRIGSGSRVVIAFEAKPFYTQLGAGLSIRLSGVQLLKLVAPGKRDFVSLGFEVQEDGYEYVSDVTPPPSQTENVAVDGSIATDEDI